MIFNFPASVEREIERYAEAEQLSPEEAAVKLVQVGLEANRDKGQGEITEADLQRLRDFDPAFAFFESLPDSTIDCIEAAMEQNRSEIFIPRV